jgi:hypothetical protein
MRVQKSKHLQDDKLYRAYRIVISLPLAIPIAVTRNNGNTPLILLITPVFLRGIFMCYVEESCSVRQIEDYDAKPHPRSRTDVYNFIPVTFDAFPQLRVRL